MQKVKILGISGSLRANSSTQMMIKEAARLFPPGVEFHVFDHIGKLPPFDDSSHEPDAVIDFKRQLKEADGVLFLTPEYAFGIPGMLKNALDWTVGSAELVHKPAALIVAATSGEHAYHALLLVFKALSLNISDDSKLLISFIRSKLNAEGQITDLETLIKLKGAIEDLVKNIQLSI
jgi:chromate reductase